MSEMIVPSEMLQEVVASLPITVDRGVGAEARRQERTRVRTHVAILVRTTDGAGADVQTVQVQVRDISIGGIGILRRTSMHLDEPFIVTLPRGANQTIGVLAHVAYWEPLAEQLVGVGARFVRILSDDELRDPKRTLARAVMQAQSLDLFADVPRRATA
jgi:hypothetical protein